MKHLSLPVAMALLAVACQAHNPPLSTGSGIAVQQATIQEKPAAAVYVPIKSPMLSLVKVKPEAKVVIQNQEVKLEVKLPALRDVREGFKTQALDFSTASKIRARITDSYGTEYTPTGAVAGVVDYPVNGVLNLTFDAVVPDVLLFVELQVTDGSDDIPQADLAVVVNHTGVTDLTTSMNFQTTPTAKAMKALLAANATRARSIDLAALATKMLEVTGQSGVDPNFSYTTHPSLVNTSQMATDLQTLLPGALTAANYRMNGATVALTVSGLVGSDQINVQVTDAASAIKTAVTNGNSSVAAATPGTGLRVKVGADPANTTQYTFTVTPGTPIALSEGGSTPVTITAVPAAVAAMNLSPSAATIGSTLTINGGGFSTNAANNTVRFVGPNGTLDVPAATVNGAGTQLTVTVPSGAYGAQDITVLVGAQQSSPALSFNVTPSFTLTPASGAVGSVVTLNGTGFHPTAGSNTVMFGAVEADVQTVNGAGTEMTVLVPETSGEQNVTVQVGTQTSASQAFKITPTLASVTAAQIVGGTLTLTGTGFSTVAANNTIRFTSGATVTAPAVTATATQLTVAVPSGLFGTQQVSVQVGDQTSGPQTLAVTPQITALSIATGSAGDTLELTGTGFHTTAASNLVQLGTHTVTATLNAGKLQVTIPNVPAGVANATVQVGTQTSAPSTFAIVPTLTSVNTVDTFMSKPALIRGASITLTGTNFDPIAANNSVMFGATAAVPTAATATQLTVTVPGVLGTAGDVLISAVTNTQNSNSITAVVPAVNVQINNSGFH
jgi:hypothetical protein